MGSIATLLARVWFAASAGVPLLVLAGVLAWVWADPVHAMGGGWLRASASMILLEFLLLHSGAFMAAGPLVTDRAVLRWSWFAGFTAFYAVALYGFALWARNPAVMWLIGATLLARTATLMILRDRKGTILMLPRSGVGMIMLFVTLFVFLIPWPGIGITEAIRSAEFGPPNDLLSSRPQRSIAWGIAYFLLMGGVELWAGWRTPDWTDAEVDAAWEKLRRKD